MEGTLSNEVDPTAGMAKNRPLGAVAATAVVSSVASSALSTQSASPGQKKQLLTLNVVGPRSSEQHENSP